MDYNKLNEIVEKLEKKHMTNETQESKEILALTQFYRIQRANDDGSENESAEVCLCGKIMKLDEGIRYTCACGMVRLLGQTG